MDIVHVERAIFITFPEHSGSHGDSSPVGLWSGAALPLFPGRALPARFIHGALQARFAKLREHR
jgi:hypothetical protein